MQRARKVEAPESSAEGDIEFGGHSFPYSTDLVSSQGCHVHIWMRTHIDNPTMIQQALAVAKHNRDVVSASYSAGEPEDYWAHQRMGWDT